AEVLRHGAKVLLAAGLVMLAGLVFALLTSRPIEGLPFLGPLFSDVFTRKGDPFEHPLLGYATLPLLPWARMIAAGTLAAFTPWFLLCFGLHLFLSELCARVPIDFRELSLQTSARAAARLARLRRGGG